MTADRKKTQAVRLANDVVESARIVSAFLNEPMAEMLSNLLRPILAKMEKEAIAERTKLGHKK